MNKIPGVEIQADAGIAVDDYKSINKQLNSFQRQNTLHLKAQEEQEEYQLRYSCRLFFTMLDYLELNFDEGWLRTNYLPKKLRCESSIQSYNIFDSKDYYDAYGNCWLLKAEMILKNPFMNDRKDEGADKAKEEADQSAVGISQRALVNDNDDAGAVVQQEEPDIDKSEGGNDLRV